MNMRAASGMEASSRTGWMRVGVGLLQGLALYGLHRASTGIHSWPATDAPVYAALILLTLFAPLVPLASLATMRLRSLMLWTLVAAAAIAMFGAWDLIRDSAPLYPGAGPRIDPRAPAVIFAAAFLFIAHHMVAAAFQERKLLAPYSAYFDTAWKHGVQLGLSLAFLGVFWLLLQLGAELFKLIGLTFLHDLLRKAWFWIPVSTTVFAAAVHLTDVKVGLTRGIRTLALTLLSWLTPLMTLIAIGFLCALPFTGLEPLWKIGRSTAILLAAAGALVVLINASYQDGSAEARAGAILRVTARITALVLTPLIAIAAYGLWLRIGQHGLTPDRIIAAACLLVGACYAAGYAFAAVLPGPWMKPLERTNILTAFVILAAILALFSPIADPTRISVDDQVARLKSGRVAPDKFDYRFLRFKAGDYGRATLKRLAVEKAGPRAGAISAQAHDTLALEADIHPATAAPAIEIPPTAISIYPAGAHLPASFMSQKWDDSDRPCSVKGPACQGFLADIDGDGRPEVVIGRGGTLSVYRQNGKGRWADFGSAAEGCPADQNAIAKGEVRVTPSPIRDLKVGGRVFHLNLRSECDSDEAPTKIEGAGKLRMDRF